MNNNCADYKAEQFEDYLKFIVVYILSLAILFLFVKGFLYLDIFEIKEQPSDFILALLATITLGCTLREYHYYRRREKAEVLGQYNERYSKDEHVNKVVDYIIRYMDGKVITCVPSTHDAEMFMRFFEEMQIQIEQERLDEKQVYDLFAYYALVLDANAEIRKNLGIKDYDKDDWCWSYFRSFVSNMAVRHLLVNTMWNSKYANAGCETITIKEDLLCFGEDSEAACCYEYKHGIIKAGNVLFKYVFKGSNKSDELHCIADNNIYDKTPIKN